MASAARTALDGKQGRLQLEVLPDSSGSLRTANVVTRSWVVQVPIVDEGMCAVFDAARSGSRDAEQALRAHLDQHFGRLEQLGLVQRNGQSQVFGELTSISGTQDSKEHLEAALARIAETRRSFLQAAGSGAERARQ